MNLQQQLVELDNLVVQGKFLEAVEQFFDDEVICYSTPDDAIYGKPEKYNATQNFFNQLSAINHIALHSQAVGHDVTMSEMTFEFSMQNGKRLVWNEVIRRTWKDGKVIEEKYYTCESGETVRETTEPHPANLYVIQHPETANIEVKTDEVVATPQLEGNNFSGSATNFAMANTGSEPQDIQIEAIKEATEAPTETAFTSSFTSFIGTPAIAKEAPLEETTLESGFDSASFFAANTAPNEEEKEETEITSLFTQGEMTNEIVEDESKEEMTTFTTTMFGTSFDDSHEESKITAFSVEEIAPIEVEEKNETILSGDKVILKGVAVNQEIPDDFGTPLVSAMSFTNAGAIDKIGMNVNIEHPFVQDLIVKLVAPSGKSIVVHNREGIVNNSIKNIQRAYGPEYFDAFKGETIAGDWKLEVSDNSKRDTGRLNGWSLYLLPEEVSPMVAEATGLEVETTETTEFMFSTAESSPEVEVSETETLEQVKAVPNLGTSFSGAGFMSLYNDEPAQTEIIQEATPITISDISETNAFTMSSDAPNLQSEAAIDESVAIETADISETDTITLEASDSIDTTTSIEEQTRAYQRLSGSNVLSQIVLVNEVIPDNYGALVSRMRFSTPRPVQEIDLELDINHPCISDLIVSLIAPSGKSVTVHNRAGGRTENLKQVYSTNNFESLKGELIAGDWKLEVFDKATTDVGRLNHWSLRILPSMDEISLEQASDVVLETESSDIELPSIADIAPSALAASVASGVTEMTSDTIDADAMIEEFMEGIEEVQTTEEAVATPAVEQQTESTSANVQITELQVNEPIPDDQNTPLISSIHLTNEGKVKDLGLFVDIEHPFCTDLQITLEAPSGKSAVVYDREGGFSTNMIHYFNSDFFPGLISEPIQGEWRLKIYDFAPQDAGKLNAWRLYILPS